jgi:hypothetical protein
MASISTKPRGQSARLTIRLGPVRTVIDTAPPVRRRNGKGQFAARTPSATRLGALQEEAAYHD